MTVADVGAGDGDFAIALARRVGPRGRVIATEVEQGLVDDIRQAAEGAGLANVSVVLSGQEDTGLDAGCCEAVLVRMVYHHFEEPAPMRAGLRAALKPGGRILVIDIVPQSAWRDLPEVPDRGGHGIAPEELIAEMTSDGFAVVEWIDGWNDDDERYGVVFERAEPPPRAPTDR